MQNDGSGGEATGTEFLSVTWEKVISLFLMCPGTPAFSNMERHTIETGGYGLSLRQTPLNTETPLTVDSLALSP